MIISPKAIPTNPDQGSCFVHARATFNNDNFGLITTQPLRLSGSDVFYGLHMIKSFDGGETWSSIEPCKNLIRKSFNEKYEIAFADATPTFHKKTGKILLTGKGIVYLNDEICPPPAPSEVLYAVYDYESGDFPDYKVLPMPDEYKFFHSGSGCSQIFELDCGDILLPIYHMDKDTASGPWNKRREISSVIRCTFDGETLKIKELGNSLTLDIPRGLGEASVIGFNGEFFLCLRNDESGYISKSDDGVNFTVPTELVFDDGKNVGNYNTQQHWLTVGNKLYLVHTRKDASNDHVFRHRAPLFISEFDTKNMCLIRSTEKIAVPERGARLGNFGCANVSEDCAYVIAAEWMQSWKNENPWEECSKHGSDNSIWLSKIEP